MPKRQTILYTSNDAPRAEGTQLYVYYCKYSGKHAFTTGEHNSCPEGIMLVSMQML